MSEWSTRGGDFVAAASAQTLVGAPNQGYTWASTPSPVADVQRWIDDPSANHGWILIGSEVDAQNAKRFDSGEPPFAAQRPLLLVHAAPVPEPATSLLIAAGLAALWLDGGARSFGQTLNASPDVGGARRPGTRDPDNT